LPYPLLSDLYLKAARAYGVVYGATGAKVDYPGLEGRGAGRAFFLVDKEGIIRGKWVGEDMAVFPNETLLKAARELPRM
jgi:peroxiredoxin